MYRIVFTSLCPRTRRLHREHDPWHEHNRLAEDWIGYLQSAGHTKRMTIESTGGDAPAAGFDLGGMVV